MTLHKKNETGDTAGEAQAAKAQVRWDGEVERSGEIKGAHIQDSTKSRKQVTDPIRARATLSVGEGEIDLNTHLDFSSPRSEELRHHTH